MGKWNTAFTNLHSGDPDNCNETHKSEETDRLMLLPKPSQAPPTDRAFYTSSWAGEPGGTSPWAARPCGLLRWGTDPYCSYLFPPFILKVLKVTLVAVNVRAGASKLNKALVALWEQSLTGSRRLSELHMAKKYIYWLCQICRCYKHISQHQKRPTIGLSLGLPVPALVASTSEWVWTPAAYCRSPFTSLTSQQKPPALPRFPFPNWGSEPPRFAAGDSYIFSPHNLKALPEGGSQLHRLRNKHRKAHVKLL